MKWGPQQLVAFDKLGPWMNDHSSSDRVKKLFGFAGTGKTELAKHLAAMSNQEWLFAAFTGKAANVLRQRGCRNATTIHSLIYRPNGSSKAKELDTIRTRIGLLSSIDRELTVDEKNTLKFLQKAYDQLTKENQPRFSVWGGSPLADPHIGGIIIDECSMVDEQVAKDLESFGKKILVMGDPGQVPPVRSTGYYTVGEPDVMLTEIYRQGELSGILQLATIIREGGRWSDFTSTKDCEVIYSDQISSDELALLVLSCDQVIVGHNETRRVWNSRYRELLGRPRGLPVREDRLVCLRNDHSNGLFNGGQWTVLAAHNDPDSFTGDFILRSEDDGRQIGIDSWLHHLMSKTKLLKTLDYEDRRCHQEFDWAYALTVHKAQGSQWDDVFIKDEPIGSARRHRYTALTRASKMVKVYVER